MAYMASPHDVVGCAPRPLQPAAMTPTILDQIVATKRQEVAAGRLRLPIEELEAQGSESCARGYVSLTG